MNDPYGRSGDFGLLGEHMVSELGRTGAPAALYNLTVLQKLVRLQTMTSELLAHSPLAAAGGSLLLVDYPLQLRLTDSAILQLVRHSFDFSFVDRKLSSSAFGLDPSKKGYFRKVASTIANNRSARDVLFPRKKYSVAAVKNNISFSDLVRQAMRAYGARFPGEVLSLLSDGTTRDIATCALLYAMALRDVVNDSAPRFAAAVCNQPANAKGLSNALKALGANSRYPGCLFVEGSAMQGRGVNPYDINDELWKRTAPEGVAKSVIPYNPSMDTHISAVLDEELGDCELPDMDSWWNSRWLWCVNGSENSESDAALGLSSVPKDGLGKQRYRRMANEEIYANPVPSWDGVTRVTRSDKLECGKVRAIFACDTASYYAFSYVLGAVQKHWRNQHVLLDPGRGGSVGVARRIAKAMSRPGVNLMLDYDDFNSHHATETMQALFRILCDRLGCPAWYKEKLVSSFDTMYIKHGRGWLRVLGTLMSGHRGTTFINSVLNRAYIRCAVGPGVLAKCVSIHTGDDVYLRLPTLGDACDLLTKCADFGCRMNPTKQSIGFNNAEFVRMGINKEYAIGYIARSIASTVAGNWVGGPTTAEDGIQNMVAAARTLSNRGLGRVGTKCLAYAVYCGRGTQRKRLNDLMQGDVALGDGPAYGNSLTIRSYAIKRDEREMTECGVDWGRHATSAYLATQTQPVEAEAMRLTSVDLVPTMLASSYRKGATSGTDRRSTGVKLVVCPPVRGKGVTDVPTLLATSVERGCLSGYPILRLIENRLSDSILEDLCKFIGVQPRPGQNIREFAFGAQSHNCCIVGALPYADASNYCKRTTSDYVIVTYPVMM